ncbi:MAG: DUF4340 domain-containing protein [Clostridia bacterium]|nr:DUF4340 domain-containing protein [Clostridia bacterium]
MKKKIIIALIVFALVVSLYAFIMFNPFETGNESAGTETNIPLFSTEENNIIGIDVNFNNQYYSLVKTNGVWSFDGQEGVHVIQPKADGIAYDISNLYAKQLVEKQAKDLKMYGLDPAVSTVVVHLSDGSLRTLLVGNRVQDGSGYYFASDLDENVYVIDNGKGMVLTYTRQDLTSTNMQEIYKGDINEITVSRNDGKSFTIKQNLESETEDWILTKPFVWDVNDDIVQSKVLNYVVALQAINYVEDKTDAELGLNTPRITVSVLKTDGNTQNYYVGNTVGNNAYVRVDGVKFPAEIDGQIVNLYDVMPFDIMNRLVQSANYYGIKNVTLNGDVDAHLKYSGKNSKLNGESISEETAIRLYSAICNLKVDAVAKNKANGKEILSAEFDYGTFSFLYKVYEYDGRNYAVTHDGQNYFLVRKDNYNAWKLAVETLM